MEQCQERYISPARPSILDDRVSSAWRHRTLRGLTIPEIIRRGALEQYEEEIEDRVGDDHSHSTIDDDLVNPLGQDPEEEYRDREPDEDRGERVEKPGSSQSVING